MKLFDQVEKAEVSEDNTAVFEILSDDALDMVTAATGGGGDLTGCPYWDVDCVTV